jgi:pimeloyl-ACP methyl ester carboxylesterase
VLDDLRTRLVRTRFAARTSAEPWASGTDPEYRRRLVAYWADGFDWRARERRLNDHSQYMADVGGVRLHFVHERGVRPTGGPDPLPLVLTHGWPSCFAEMLPLVPLLVDPGAHGGDPADAFDVVVPSLPGFLFSGLPAEGRLTMPRIADLWAGLMTATLGYARFGAYGGDTGAQVTHWLGARHPDKLVGIHLLHPAIPASPDPGRPYSAAELAYLDRREAEDEDDAGYAAIQATRPDTLAAALNDSPAGLAAWIVDKWRAWGDTGGDVDARFGRDALLTIATLYWATSTIGSSFRVYYDYRHTPERTSVTAPMAATLGVEDRGFPRELAERVYTDVRRWREPTAGGHFLPMEEPELLAEELRAHFRLLRDP